MCLVRFVFGLIVYLLVCLFFDCLFAFMVGMFSNYVVIADSFPDYVFKMCEHGFTIVPLCWLGGFVFTTLSLLFGKN